MGRKTLNPPSDNPISIYLGPAAIKVQRMQRLDDMAAERGISRSTLFQLIADGVIPLGDKNGRAPKYVARYEPETP